MKQTLAMMRVYSGTFAHVFQVFFLSDYAFMKQTLAMVTILDTHGNVKLRAIKKIFDRESFM